MLITELEAYGNIEYSYEGRGHFDGDSETYDFAVVQQSNGSIYLACDFPSYTSLSQVGDNVEKDFIGITIDDKPLVMTGHKLRINAKNQYAIFVTNGECRLQIGNIPDNQPLEFRFLLTNFIFHGTQVEQLIDGSKRLNALVLQLGNISAVIRKVIDYPELEDQLRKQRGVMVTSYVVIKDREFSELDSILEKLTNLCGLLTIANGTLISWIRMEIFSKSGEQLFIEHQPRITGNYSSFKLIDSMPPEAVELFVNHVFERYEELNVIYDLNSVARIYASIKSSGFIEIRSLGIVALVELLLDKFDQEHRNSRFLVPRKKFERKKESLQNSILNAYRSEFEELNLSESIINEVREKILELNRRSFKNRLKNFIQFFSIPIEDDEIGNFIESRNKLVHGLAFVKNSPADEYFTNRHFLDRILLGMLKYRGYYINPTQKNLWSGEQRDYFEPKG